MRISDLDYLESIPETDAMHVNGGRAIAISEFLALVYGDVSNISTIVKNRSVSGGDRDSASSYVNVTATGIDDGYLVVSSFSYASSGD